MSTCLFVLCAEVLAIKIRNNKNIKGKTINNTEYKLSQYADDTSVILDGSSTSLNETLNVLSSYAKYSGLKINFDKTSVVWIGMKKYSTDTIKTRWKLSWGKSNFKLLGIHINVELHTMLELNYKEKLSKMKNLIQIWKRRYLTPLGKITFIKSILISLLTHLFISLPNPTSSIIKQLKTMLLDFLWEGPQKIKQNVLVKDYSEGGLKMINIDAFIKGLKAIWIRRLIISNSKWQCIIKSNLNIKDLINFGKSYSESLIKQINNPFWSDFVKSYSSVIQLKEKNTTEYFLSSPIFHNPEILIEKKDNLLSAVV